MDIEQYYEYDQSSLKVGSHGRTRMGSEVDMRMGNTNRAYLSPLVFASLVFGTGPIQAETGVYTLLLLVSIHDGRRTCLDLGMDWHTKSTHRHLEDWPHTLDLPSAAQDT